MSIWIRYIDYRSKVEIHLAHLLFLFIKINKEVNYAYQYLSNTETIFKGILYIPEGSGGDSKGFLRIIADGKTIYTSPNMTPTSYPVEIDVDVTGYNDVKIEFSGIYNSGTFATPLCLGEVGFYQ